MNLSLSLVPSYISFLSNLLVPVWLLFHVTKEFANYLLICISISARPPFTRVLAHGQSSGQEENNESRPGCPFGPEIRRREEADVGGNGGPRQKTSTSCRYSACGTDARLRGTSAFRYPDTRQTVWEAENAQIQVGFYFYVSMYGSSYVRDKTENRYDK